MALDFTKQRMRIVDSEHPHTGESGFLTGKVTTLPHGARMAEFTLDDCRHGMEACFVSAGSLAVDRRKGRDR